MEDKDKTLDELCDELLEMIKEIETNKNFPEEGYIK